MSASMAPTSFPSSSKTGRVLRITGTAVPSFRRNSHSMSPPVISAQQRTKCLADFIALIRTDIDAQRLA